MKKSVFKSVAAAVMLSVILFTSASCSKDQVKNTALGVIRGQPAQSGDDHIPREGENAAGKIKSRNVEVVENTNNYCVIEQQDSTPAFKYTVSRAYEVSNVADAGLTYSDFPQLDGLENWITKSGETADSDYTFLCVDMSVEQLSDVDTTYTAPDFDVKKHCMQTLTIFSETPETSMISYPDHYAMKLYETEDITRSKAETEYNFYSLVKGQTAYFTFCFIVKRADLDLPNLSVLIAYVGAADGGKVKEQAYHIPLNIEFL